NIPVHTVNEALQHKDIRLILESYRDAKVLEAHQQIRVKSIQNKYERKSKKSSKQWQLDLTDALFRKVVTKIRKSKSMSEAEGEKREPDQVEGEQVEELTQQEQDQNQNQNQNQEQEQKKNKEKEELEPLDWAIFQFETMQLSVKKMTVELYGSGGVAALALHLKKVNQLRYCLLHFQYGHIAIRKKLLLVIWVGGQPMEQSELVAMFKHKRSIEETLGQKYSVSQLTTKTLTINSSTRLKRSMILSQLAREGLVSEILIRVVIKMDDNDEKAENYDDYDLEHSMLHSHEIKSTEVSPSFDESVDDAVSMPQLSLKMRMEREIQMQKMEASYNSYGYEEHSNSNGIRNGNGNVNDNTNDNTNKKELSILPLTNLQVTLIPDTFKKEQFSKFKQVKTAKMEKLLTQENKTLHELDLIHGSLIYLSHLKQHISHKKIRVDRQKNLERIFSFSLDSSIKPSDMSRSFSTPQQSSSHVVPTFTPNIRKDGHAPAANTTDDTSPVTPRLASSPLHGAKHNEHYFQVRSIHEDAMPSPVQDNDQLIMEMPQYPPSDISNEINTIMEYDNENDDNNENVKQNENIDNEDNNNDDNNDTNDNNENDDNNSEWEKTIKLMINTPFENTAPSPAPLPAVAPIPLFFPIPTSLPTLIPAPLPTSDSLQGKPIPALTTLPDLDVLSQNRKRKARSYLSEISDEKHHSSDAPLTLSQSNTEDAPDSPESKLLFTEGIHGDFGANAVDLIPYPNTDVEKYVQEDNIDLEDVQIIREKVGQGKTAVVHKAIYKEQVTVALKEYKFGRLTEQIMKDFHREVRVLKQLRHPNIALLLASHIDTETKELFLLLEWLPGGCLFDVLMNKEFEIGYLDVLTVILYQTFTCFVSSFKYYLFVV
ncbi:protein kinase, TKL group, partial [Reticulomyxa filosa]